MSRALVRLAAAGAGLLLAGCPANRDTRPGAGAPDAAVALAPRPERPEQLEVSVRYQQADGGMDPVVFSAAARPVIEPTADLEIATNLPLENYRVRLFDEADRAMVSDDEAENQGDHLLYRIHLPEPLAPGHRYALAVDAQTGASVIDAYGKSHPDQRLELQIAGEREKRAAKAPARRHRRH